MRVLVDANVLISAMLPPKTSGESAIRALLDGITHGDATLLVADETTVEVRGLLETKPWFVRHIPTAVADQFFRVLWETAELLPSLAYDAPRRCRDRKDDYLLEQAIRFRADILVTGDDDLLALDGTIEGLRILLPRTLLDELSAGTG